MRPRERNSEKSSMAEQAAEIEVPKGSIDAAIIFHVVSDVLAFLLYMHQQIPSLLQDMTLAYNSLQIEFKELEVTLTQAELNASSRRIQIGRKRDIKMETKRTEKLMNTVSSIQNAFQLMICQFPNVERIIFIFGASPRRPRHVYEICFPHGTMDSLASESMTRSRATELLSRKIIRAFISKGVGSTSYSGPSKLFLLVKAPTSFSMPLHFLPKRDFQFGKKVVPFKVQLRSRNRSQETGDSYVSEVTTGFNVEEDDSNGQIWFQCRHVIKGLVIANPSPEE